ADVTDGLTVTMANGDDATFTVTDGTVMIGAATVTTADVMSSNGIIHIIDSVLMPPADLVNDIPTVAGGTGVHTSLVAALTKANLVTTLQGDGPFTVFAPTDQAFTDAGIDLDAFSTDEEIATLTDILLYHVYSGAVNATDVTDGLTVAMANGDNATFTVTDGTVMVGAATVMSADVMATNGIIHVIDAVLMPPAVQTPEGEICYNMVTHTIVPGSDASICAAYMYLEDYEMNGQNVTGCYNSVTHQVSNISQAICESYVWTEAVDIPTTAMATGMHDSLVAALIKADLVTTLQGDGPFTVFAPTDEAFAAAGIDLDSFTTDEEIATLADILLYHVYSGAVNAADVTDGLTVTMANGDDATFTVTDGTVMVGDATVVLADVPVSNGVIHVIDMVLMPPAEMVCDVTIGISSDGYAFSPASVTIDVGQTVCWKWSDTEMAHNVKEVDGMKSTKFVSGGLTSGAAEVNVDFSHTFSEDTTFYYACEPHISLDMFGKVTVGDGDVEPTVKDKSDSDNNTPGFLGATMILATLGAVLFARTNRSEEQ
ncbi:MAG: fasciclin domain-containing protein, partial [Candidatus Poseidoniales archaeon]